MALDCLCIFALTCMFSPALAYVISCWFCCLHVFNLLLLRPFFCCLLVAQHRSAFEQLCLMHCSRQTCNADGSWMPVAVRTLPYSLRWQKGQFKKEYKAMKAVAGTSHTVTVLSEDTGKVKGRSMKFIAMRYMFAL